ncbi:MAG: glutamate racemase [Gammaproteobacteria bacterium]|nr:glutamate racemase [Gammaproteobacteria bacterium]
MNRDAAIGVFDSGVGGLTVLRALREKLPEENLLYLGDTARLPYGTKSARSVLQYALQATRILDKRGIKMLVIACNTASAYALDALSETHPDLPVVGVIAPGAQAACETSKSGRIGVLATESTVRAGAYEKSIANMRSGAEVHSSASPLLVGLAEEGWLAGEVPEAVIRHYLGALTEKFAPGQMDCLLLGCTHFPVLAKSIEKIAGPDVALVDSAHTTAIEVEKILGANQLRRSGGGQIRFLATDGVARFARVGGVFLGKPLEPDQVELVDL